MSVLCRTARFSGRNPVRILVLLSVYPTMIFERPQDIPLAVVVLVDVFELSIVFANALENAIQAVRELPVEQRHIICKSVMSPRFMIEILNSYTGEIIFDQRGIPVANKAGHGIGTRSIVAFAEKHNALYRFQAENGWFKLQIVMQCGDRGIP